MKTFKISALGRTPLGRTQRSKQIFKFIINTEDAPDKNSLGVALSAALYGEHTPIVPSDVCRFMEPLSETQDETWRKKLSHRVLTWTLTWRYDQTESQYIIDVCEDFIDAEVDVVTTRATHRPFE